MLRRYLASLYPAPSLRSRSTAPKRRRRIFLEQLESRDLLASFTISWGNSNDATVTEGNNVTIPIFLTTDGPLSGDVTVNTTSQWWIGSGSDYSISPDSVVFSASSVTAAGTYSRNTTFTASSDSVVDPGEVVVYYLNGGSYYLPDSWSYGVSTRYVNITDNDATTVSVAATDASASEASSGNGTFTITLAGGKVAPEEGIDVYYTLGGTATEGSDYQSLPSTATIPGGASSTTVTIDPIDDAVVENGGEAVTLTITDTSNGSVTVSSTKTASVSISDNDATTVSISATDASANETAGNTGKFTVSLAGGKTAPAGGIVVNYGVSGSAVNGTDYSFLSGSVTIPAGSNSTTVTVTPTNDTIVEAVEAVMLTLNSTNNASVTIGGTSSASVSINDNDTATFTIEDVTVNEGDGTLTFVVSLSNQIDIPVDVDVSYGNTSTGADDFDHAEDSVSFGLLSTTTQSVVVAIEDDDIVEATEKFLASLSTTTPLGGRNLNLSDTASGSITDNDTATFTVEDVTVNEADGTATFEISLDKQIDIQVDINVNYGNNTTGAGDLDFTADQVTFSALSTGKQTVTVAINDDDIVEATEKFQANLSTTTSLSGRSLDLNDTASGTIIDNDVATFTVEDVTVNEATGTLTFEVASSNPIDFPVTIDLTYGDVSTSAGDFNHTPGQANFSNFSTLESVTVPLTNDNIVEATETFLASLSSTTSIGDRTIVTSDTAVGTITNDDSATLTISHPSTTEGGQLVFTVKLSNAVQGGLEVDFTSSDVTANDGSSGVREFGLDATCDGLDDDDSGATDEDFVSFPGPGGTFAVCSSGQTFLVPGMIPYSAENADYSASFATLQFTGNANEEVTITINTDDDNIVEATETMSMVLGNLVATDPGIAPASLSTVGSPAIGTILDNDTATFTIDDVTVNEGDGTLTFDISVDKPIDVLVNVDVAYSTTTTNAGDLDYTTSTAVFNALSTDTVSVTVTINDDNIVEATEAFLAQLSTNTSLNGRSLNFSDEATGTIIDNDVATFTVDDATVNEADGTLTFTVSVSNPIDIPVELDVNYGDTSTSTNDFDHSADGITFGALDTTPQQVTVDITNDLFTEGTETFLASLGVTTSLATLSGRELTTSDTAIGAIVDNDIDLQITKTGNVSPVVAGSGVGNLVYIIEVENVGLTTATNVGVFESLTLPMGASVVSITPSVGGSYVPDTTTTGTWTISSLNVSASATLTVVLTVDGTATHASIVSDTATIVSAGEVLVQTEDDIVSLSTSVLARDFGDAPDDYGTLADSNGASHNLGSGLKLGASLDSEGTGRPSVAANGDDTDLLGDDEDGVVFSSTLVPRTTAAITVNASAAAKLDAWIDFNRNGIFETGEAIATNLSVAAGANTLNVVVPETAVAGTSYARFRLSSSGSLTPTGNAADGEVEDYALTIVSPAPSSSQIVEDPQHPGHTLLLVNGSALSDAIIVQPVPGQPGQIRVVFPGIIQGPYAVGSFERIEVFGHAGSDAIVIDASIVVPATLHGDDGNDSIVGGSGNDLLYGDAGIDSLSGGAGNDVVHGGNDADYLYGGVGDDVLIGGAGQDWLFGDGGDDILIGSSGPSSQAQLLAIQATWSSGLTFSQRTTDLSSALNSSTVTDDLVIDFIYGSTGSDWQIDYQLRDMFLDYLATADKKN